MRRILVSLARAESGATAIEYALIVALVALVIITGVTSVGLTLAGVFETIAVSF